MRKYTVASGVYFSSNLIICACKQPSLWRDCVDAHAPLMLSGLSMLGVVDPYTDQNDGTITCNNEHMRMDEIN